MQGHTSLLVRNILANNKIVIMPKPPYPPDLAPYDFFLFSKLKRPIKGWRFAMIEERAQDYKYTKKCFKDWKKRWHKCIISEGDNIDIDE